MNSLKKDLPQDYDKYIPFMTLEPFPEESIYQHECPLDKIKDVDLNLAELLHKFFQNVYHD